MKREQFLRKWAPGGADVARDLDVLLREERDRGATLAAEVARDYDRYSSHPFLVSECILGKLNILKGKPRKNKSARELNRVIDSIEKKVDSIQGMTRFMAGMAKWQNAQGKRTAAAR